MEETYTTVLPFDHAQQSAALACMKSWFLIPSTTNIHAYVYGMVYVHMFTYVYVHICLCVCISVFWCQHGEMCANPMSQCYMTWLCFLG